MSDREGGAAAHSLTRRRMLESLAALAFASLAGRAAAELPPKAGAVPSPEPAARAGATSAPFGAAALLAAAAKLDAAALLDDALGTPYLAALTASVGEPALARLAALVETTTPAQLDAAIAKAGLEPAARAVVAAFYSGLTGEGVDRKLVTYLMALVWGAAPFTKPPSLCGGPFGYWAEPPAGVKSEVAATAVPSA